MKNDQPSLDPSVAAQILFFETCVETAPVARYFRRANRFAQLVIRFAALNSQSVDFYVRSEHVALAWNENDLLSVFVWVYNWRDDNKATKARIRRSQGDFQMRTIFKSKVLQLVQRYHFLTSYHGNFSEDEPTGLDIRIQP